jgi:hypothetical protein
LNIICICNNVFFCGEFSPLGDKEKGGAGESNKGKIWGIVFQNSPYFEEKRLEVARFRQCVTIRRQN